MYSLFIMRQIYIFPENIGYRTLKIVPNGSLSINLSTELNIFLI
jgi:beta-galactosidase/beta-glucuronidase